MIDEHLAAVLTTLQVKGWRKKSEPIILDQQGLAFVGRRVEMIRSNDGIAFVAMVINDGEAIPQIVHTNNRRLAFFQFNLFAPA